MPMPQLEPPADGVSVRMYRQGHGDCLLLAFPRESGGPPVYMMVDCGYKPGSQIDVGARKVQLDEVVNDIAAATANRLDVVAVTHEHQDHVNGLKKFAGFAISEAWFAWTEDPDDPLAKEFRARHQDQLLGLIEARNQLQMLAGAEAEGRAAVSRLDQLLELEIGNDVLLPEMLPPAPVQVLGFGAAADPANSQNKQAMKVIKDAAGIHRFLSPHAPSFVLPGSKGVRIYVLGPPRDADLLKDEDPRGDAAFPGHMALGTSSLSFFAAATQGTEVESRGAPFALTYGVAKDTAFDESDPDSFFRSYYGSGPNDDHRADETPDGADWRRIDEEWLYSAESFALKLNTGVNNTSLVLAIELPVSKKVLLLAADAQYGNWMSWDDGSWTVAGRKITVRDLLGRTVLYKVGHHGSHNATLKGEASSDYPNLWWMATADGAAEEFTAMIPAHRDWALNTAGWDHPLPSIRSALMRKAQGRVLEIDKGAPDRPPDLPLPEWLRFTGRLQVSDLFIQYDIEDSSA
ncbi:hypothetical protein [Salipiger mangrovisoli]|uniref:Metallo-beta-lactamase superfamily protein n=1 Tax=Salipiger mangrovisoli TaxID=2865933 RepID=A0ABR9X1H0_9RHOB|nr:hypothetical protein [Salipiger mangrovisoli]MBE9637371.1 hypothetical protein [Salipiger mangrovisoli]